MGERQRLFVRSLMAAELKPLVKICGTQDPDSAVIAAKAGADFIGMIFVPKSKCAASCRRRRARCSGYRLPPLTLLLRSQALHERGACAGGRQCGGCAETDAGQPSRGALRSLNCHKPEWRSSSGAAYRCGIGGFAADDTRYGRAHVVHQLRLNAEGHSSHPPATGELLPGPLDFVRCSRHCPPLQGVVGRWSACL